MEPRDFHTTAEFLKDFSEEPHIRTSISRSYYGVFLYFRDFLAKNGLTKKKNKKCDVHAFIKNCLQFCQVREGNIAAVHINNLAQWRTDADYDLDKTFLNTDSRAQFNDAKQVIENFERDITSEKTKKILKFATDHAKWKGWI